MIVDAVASCLQMSSQLFLLAPIAVAADAMSSVGAESRALNTALFLFANQVL